MAVNIHPLEWEPADLLASSCPSGLDSGVVDVNAPLQAHE